MRMTRAVVLGWAAVLAFAGAAPAPAADDFDFDWKEYQRRARITMKVRDRAQELYPRRRDEPLREANITDNEIREIEALVESHLPRAIVNIGPVVTGCPCEEGSQCTDQVWLQANTARESVGMLLSRSRNRWDLSTVQKWWLRRWALEREESELDWRERGEREWALVQDFPVCTEPPGSSDNVAARSSAEPRK